MKSVFDPPAHFRTCSSLGSNPISPDPPSLFVLHKLRILPPTTRRIFHSQVYGHSPLKDQFRVTAERLKPIKIHRSVTVLDPQKAINTAKRPRNESIPVDRLSTRSMHLRQLSEEIIKHCDHFQTVNLDGSRKGGEIGKQRPKGKNRGIEDWKHSYSDPSSLVLRFERNNQSHRKRVIGRSRSFLQRRS